MKRWLVLVVMIMVVAAGAAAQGRLSPRQCSIMKNDLKKSCGSVVLSGKASAACCQLVKAANLECVCEFMTPKLIAAIGGRDRTIGFIRGCGRTLPRNFKCGSLITPP